MRFVFDFRYIAIINKDMRSSSHSPPPAWTQKGEMVSQLETLVGGGKYSLLDQLVYFIMYVLDVKQVERLVSLKAHLLFNL